MRFGLFFAVAVITILIYSLSKSQPSFNGNTPGCGGSGCHTQNNSIVTAEVLSNNRVRITVSGTTSVVAGELVDANNGVVAVINSTSSNPFILTAPGAGTYKVNAGYKSPSRTYGTTSVEIALTGVNDKQIGGIPQYYELYSNYPNPFNPETRIRYAVPSPGFTSLKIYNISGEQVAVLVNEFKPAGIYEVSFKALNLVSGTYIYKLEAGNFTDTKKMVLLK